MSMIDRIHTHLRERGPLNVGSCFSHYGTAELRHYIAALRKAGVDVKDIKRKGKNRYGECVSWKEYFIAQFKLEGEEA